MSDPLIDSLRYRPVATTAAQMREAADRIERLERELAAWLQVWDNVHLDVPELNTRNKPLAVACTYELVRRERDVARAALAEAQRDAGRYRWLVNAGSENSPIARAQAVYHLWNGEDGTDGFTRALDAAIAKEQSHASE